jgi:hypothetical protein
VFLEDFLALGDDNAVSVGVFEFKFTITPGTRNGTRERSAGLLVIQRLKPCTAHSGEHPLDIRRGDVDIGDGGTCDREQPR